MRPSPYAARRDRLRVALASAGADAVLVTRLVNVGYLTGFTGSHGALLVTHDAAVLATDGRYRTSAAAEAPDVERVIDREVGPTLAARAAREGVRRLAVEEHDVTLARYDALGEAVASAGGPTELVRLGHAVEALRAVKDEGELALLRRACAIGDLALADLLDSVVPGRTERSVARELEARLLDHGADGLAFPTIVASGPNSAVPHHRPTERRIETGDFLTVDFGGRRAGYHADCTRTFVVGAEPAPWQHEVYRAVEAAQRAGRQALAPDAVTGDVDQAARSVVEAAGFGEAFVHGLGHGVGLEIHEAPLLGPGQTATLAARTPVTVEPGIYLEGRGGVRIEDTLVVRAPVHGGPDGGTHPELLTTTTRELLVLG